jgi:NitT/TauT family transport system ATP-binding protein
MMPHVELNQITLQFHNDHPPILGPIDLRVNRQEFISIVGRSGCGKTSLLQMVAGLISPSKGEVIVSGKRVTEPREELAYVFQRPVMLEWRTVLENVLLPIELRQRVEDTHIEGALHWLELVGLKEAEGKFPHELSGGMLSRTALVRALLAQPDILLMDEPFAALDALTKEQLQMELHSISSRYERTVMFVTHDIQEAAFLSDRVIVLGGSPSQVVREFTVPFGKQRKKSLTFTPDFLELVKEIYHEVEKT